MSAPDTDLERQRRRHRGPILGISFGLVFVALLALADFVWPGIPLDRQAAPDGAPSETSGGDAASSAPGTTADTEADAESGETR